jgi:hypothetical protein
MYRPSRLIAGASSATGALAPLMRVVVGVQFAAPRHVSRTNTCRVALLAVAETLALNAKNTTNLPEALIAGSSELFPESVSV